MGRRRSRRGKSTQSVVKCVGKGEREKIEERGGRRGWTGRAMEQMNWKKKEEKREK